MTWFDIKKLHAPALDGEAGSVIEVDYYHASTLLVQSEALIAKAKADLDVMLGGACRGEGCGCRGGQAAECGELVLPGLV